MPHTAQHQPQTRDLASGVVLAALLLWTFLVVCTPLWSNDIWWHLRTGQLILERGGIPRLDWFTFTSSDRAWIDLHWGFQLLVTGLHALGGVDLLVIAKAACVTAAVAIGWLATPGLPAAARALCWILPVVCISGRAMVRPEMLTFVLLAITLYLLARAERRLVWLLPVVQLVWVNCHGLFVLGLVAWGAALLDRLAREALGGRYGLAPAPSTPALRTLGIAAALSIAACFANPYFADGALFPFALFQKFGAERELYSDVGEFRRPIEYVLQYGLFRSPYLAAQVALWLVTALSFGWLARERRLALGRLALFAAFSLLAWNATRNVAIFAIASGVVLSANCAEALELRSRRAHSSGARMRLRPAFDLAVTALLAAFAASVISGHWVALWGEKKAFGLGERPGYFAHDAARFAGQAGMPDRAFASHFGVASLYSFYHGPERRVFIDGRLEVASPETFRAYLKTRFLMTRRDPAWQESFARGAGGHLPAVVLDLRYHQREIAGVLATPGWRAVYADRLAVVLIEEDLAERLELPPVLALKDPPDTRTNPDR